MAGGLFASTWMLQLTATKFLEIKVDVARWVAASELWVTLLGAHDRLVILLHSLV